MVRSQRADLFERAEALLDAAASEVLDRGSTRIRIDAVARRAEVGKGTVYLHWSSREQLVLAVGAREAASMLDGVAAAMRDDPFEIALHRYLRRHFLDAVTRPLLRLIFGTGELDAVARRPERESIQASKLVAHRDYLTALADRGLLRRGLDPDELDYSLQAVAFGFFAAAPLLPDVPAQRRADRLAEVVRRSFEPDRAPARERYESAAPEAIAAFESLARDFRGFAYGSAAD